MERRDFIKFLPAAFVAIAAGCRRPEEKIVPRIYPGKHTKAGVPEYFNTLYSYGSVCYGITVKLYDGRPIKIDGNIEHPVNQGKSNAQMQASLYSLYDPKRFNKPRIGGSEVSLDDAVNYWKDNIKSDMEKDKKIRILINEHCSIAFSNLISEIEDRYANVKFVILSPSRYNSGERKVNSKLFGIDELTYYDLSKVKTVVSFGADFLGSDEQSLSNSISYSKKGFEIVTFESEFSLTGANSMKRYAVHPNDMERLIEAILWKYLNNTGKSDIIQKYKLVDDFNKYDLDNLINNLIKDRGEAFILCGDKHSMRCKELTALLNYHLGVYNNILNIRHSNTNFYSKAENVDHFIDELNNNEVSSVIISDIDFEYLSPIIMNKIKSCVRKENLYTISLYHNDTTKDSMNFIPSTHYLESWGDGITYSGIKSIRQPLIMPLNSDSISFEDLIIKMFSKHGSYYEYLRKEWENLAPDEQQWENILRKGFANITDNKNNIITEYIKEDIQISDRSNSDDNELSLLVLPSNNLLFGEFFENDWLRELHDPINKTVWQSYAYINEKISEEYELEDGHIIEIVTNELKIELPVCINKRISNNCVIVYMGYDKSQHIYDIMNNNIRKIKIYKTNKIDKILRVNNGEVSINDLHFSKFSDKKNSDSVFKYKNHKWTMVIDTNKCIGCNSCIIACQIENNIAIVGKEEIEKSRTLHWMRIENAIDDVGNFTFVPIMCQHCDNAPCEKVCPVSATTHSPEGINEMTYNRCIGTRYCMANCPYDVRRFNFKEYHDNEKQPYKNIYNPVVTVRMRGIVEKCTFCVQRINDEKYKQKNRGKNQIPDGSFQTACQQACPTSAIYFGNILDNNSVVSKKIKESTTFRMLEEMNTEPSVHYIL